MMVDGTQVQVEIFFEVNFITRVSEQFNYV